MNIRSLRCISSVRKSEYIRFIDFPRNFGYNEYVKGGRDVIPWGCSSALSPGRNVIPADRGRRRLMRRLSFYPGLIFL